jgi:SnoaL-like polyketide cyclase
MNEALPPVLGRMLDLWNGKGVDPGDVFERVPDDLAATVARYRAAFPDLRWEIDDWLVIGARYVLRMHATGTHAGEPFRFEGIELHTIRDDRIVDSDQVWDLGALYAVP